MTRGGTWDPGIRFARLRGCLVLSVLLAGGCGTGSREDDAGAGAGDVRESIDDPGTVGDPGSADDPGIDAGDEAVDAGTDAAGEGVDAGPDAAPVSCPAIEPAVSAGDLQGTDLAEVSGLVASRRHAGVLWGHNDSGDTPRVFALVLPGEGGEAAVQAIEYTLNRGMVGWEGVEDSWEKMADDWEDISLGPFAGFGGDAIFVGDTGDNSLSRESIRLYVFPEPSELVGGDIRDVRFFDIVYEDGPRDCESLFVDPRTGDVYLVEKEYVEDVASVYRVDAGMLDGAHEGPLVAKGVGRVPVAVATGADMSADGGLLAIRNYGQFEAPGLNGLLFTRDAGTTIEEMLASRGCPLPNVVDEPAQEFQGETIAFAPDGSGFYTASERIFVPQPVHFWGLAR